MNNFIDSIQENGFSVLFQFSFIALSVLIIIKLLEFLLQKRFERIAEKTKNDIDDLFTAILESLNIFFDIGTSILIAALVVNLEDTLNFYIIRITFTVVLFFLIRALINVINFAFKKVIISHKEEKEYDPTMLKVAGKFTGGLIWVLAIIFILQNLGFNVSAVVGGLGIAGIAVAFGLQSILQDIFSFFSIYMDKPYKIGDFIVVGKDMGTVKKIGLKSTKLKTLQGQDLILSNREMTQARINNYHGMKERRVVLSFGVDYKTPISKLEKLPDIIEKIIRQSRIKKVVEFKRAHFTEFGEWAYIFEVVYIINDSDYKLYLDIQQEINLAILKYLEKENIKLASKISYPL